jgi:hypothetical protein
MYRTQRIILLFVFLSGSTLACRLTPAKARTYENEVFSVTIPAGWQTLGEIWGKKAVSGQEYKGLGVQELVTLQYPPKQGSGKAFFVVASSPLVEGQDLESRFNDAYLDANPEIENASQQSFEQGEWVGYEMTYKRPWGEPWWQFRDIWLEKGGAIYVLSFYASSESFETYADTFNQILESFQFKD